MIRAYRQDADPGRRAALARVGRGVVERGEICHAHFSVGTCPVWVKKVARFGQGLGRAEAGQNVEVLATTPDGSHDHPIEVGAVVAGPGTVRTAATFEARLTLFKAADGEQARYVRGGFTPSILLPGVRREARIELLDRLRAAPGESVDIRTTFDRDRPALVEPGDAFVCRDTGRLIGHGTAK